MKIAELSRRSGAPIPTIKFYIREGMLPRGERTGRNQAAYTDAHVARLELIATLRGAGLSLAVIKQALRAMDATGGDSPDFMAIAVDALAPPRPARDGVVNRETEERAGLLLRAIAHQRGWMVDEDCAAWQGAVHACATILDAWPSAFTEADLDRYAAVAEQMAAFELPETWNPAASRAEALTYVVLGTVLFEPLILALRRLAHVDRGNQLRAERRGERPLDPRAPKSGGGS